MTTDEEYSELTALQSNAAEFKEHTQRLSKLRKAGKLVLDAEVTSTLMPLFLEQSEALVTWAESVEERLLELEESQNLMPDLAPSEVSLLKELLEKLGGFLHAASLQTSLPDEAKKEISSMVAKLEMAFQILERLNAETAEEELDGDESPETSGPADSDDTESDDT